MLRLGPAVPHGPGQVVGQGAGARPPMGGLRSRLVGNGQPSAVAARTFGMSIPGPPWRRTGKTARLILVRFTDSIAHDGGVEERRVALLQRQLHVVLREMRLDLGPREGEEHRRPGAHRHVAMRHGALKAQDVPDPVDMRREAGHLPGRQEP